MIQENLERTVAGDVMNPTVYMLPSTANLKHVTEMMRNKNISAVFFHEEDTNQYYILTHTDIIDILNKGLLNCTNIEDICVSDIMVGPVEMLEEDEPIDTVIHYLEDHHFKRTLICRDGKPIGVISLRDILDWMDLYFKKAKPQILLILDNESGITIGKHFFKENIDDKVDKNLMELYGSALKSISHITNEVMGKASLLKKLVGDKTAILFEVFYEITGILICDRRSIELHQKLHKITRLFYYEYQDKIKKKGMKEELDLTRFIKIFKI